MVTHVETGVSHAPIDGEKHYGRPSVLMDEVMEPAIAGRYGGCPPHQFRVYTLSVIADSSPGVGFPV